MVLLFSRDKKSLPHSKDEGSARGTTLFRRSIRPTNRGSTILMKAITGHNRNTLFRCIQRIASGIRLPSHVQEPQSKGARTRWPLLSGDPVLSTPLVPCLLHILYTRIPLTLRFVNCLRKSNRAIQNSCAWTRRGMPCVCRVRGQSAECADRVHCTPLGTRKACLYGNV